MKHTPGPWTNNASASRMTVTDKKYNPICLVLGHSSPEESIATARLIAAAPELLEICKTILKRLDLEAMEKGEDAIFPRAGMHDDLRKLIQRAEGETE